MPQRLLRPQIRQSKRWNRLGWLDQSLYIRLLTMVDDYGRYEADPELLRSEAFPYGDPDGKIIPVQTIDSALRTFVRTCMANVYEVEGVKYLQLLKWKERARSESRYPDPGCGHLPANASKCQQMIASPPQPKPQPKPSPEPSCGVARAKGKQPSDPTTFLSASPPPENQAINHPDLNAVMKHFMQCSDYSQEEIRLAFASFEAAAQDGMWWWGRRFVSDWRAAMESRMGDTRAKRPQSIKAKSADWITREMDAAVAATQAIADQIDEENKL